MTFSTGDMNGLLPRKLPAQLDALTSLALDLRWTWSHGGDALWRLVDAASWEQTQNPWLLLQDIPQRRLEELASDPVFCSALARCAKERQEYMTGPSWFSTNGARLKNERVAYFSMEFGLGQAIPLYAGGLGILAGDYLKTASDLALPIVGIGILFQERYFRQAIDAAGEQRESYPHNDPTTLPIQPVGADGGGWLRVPIELPGRTVWLRVWRANVGRVDLYLLDANEPRNSAVDRGITAKLYGGGVESRLVQETPAPEMVRVELFAEPSGNEQPFRRAMQQVAREGSSSEHLFATTVFTKRDVGDFTPRVVPAHVDARTPAECALIAWPDGGFTPTREGE